MRRGEAYVRFPLRLSHHVGQFSAGIVILSEDLRYAQIIRELPGLWWNLQDLNVRPLPLSVKRRISPRPRFRMPPSFRGVSSVAFGAKHVVGWLVTVFLYGLPSGVVPDFSSCHMEGATLRPGYVGWFSAVRHMSFYSQFHVLWIGYIESIIIIIPQYID